MNQNLRQPRVVILGAGMTGILLVIKLKQAGVRDIIVLEKGHELGGTWRDNRYPGVACDVPAHMYTYRFEPNPDWHHRFARGEEIQAYFSQVADKYGVRDKIRFGQTVNEAQFHDGVWHLLTNTGEQLSCDLFISATGVLHKPVIPDIPGMADFTGEIGHSTDWDPAQDISGQRIGIIGTGSTATQMVAALAEDPRCQQAGQMTLFQRTPQWIFPMPDRDYYQWERALCRRFPRWMNTVRWGYENLLMNLFQRSLTGGPLAHGIIASACKAYLRWQIREPVLREKLTPDYTVGCKRLVVSGRYYQALKKNNVALECAGIERFTPTGIRTKDGRHIDLDRVVLATGFDPRAYLRPINMTGLNGQTLEAQWAAKVQAYRSLLLPNFPNFILMLGPNTPIGNWSVIAMSEVQTDYVLKLVEGWQQGRFDTLEASPEATKRFNDYLKSGMANTVWISGCQSWYLDKDGDPLSWPYSWKQWVTEMAEPEWGDLLLRKLDRDGQSKVPLDDEQAPAA